MVESNRDRVRVRDRLDMDDQSQEQLAQVLESVGPLCEYRSPEHIVQVMRGIDRSMANRRERFRALSAGTERTVYAPDLIEEIIPGRRSRAGMCETAHPDVASENVDFHHLTSEWLEFVESGFEQQVPTGRSDTIRSGRQVPTRPASRAASRRHV